jgi:hypothetical protein
VLCLAALAESRPLLRLETVWKRPPAVYAALPTGRTVILAEFPFPATAGALAGEGRYMYFSTFHWHTLVNGNSGSFPPAYYVLSDEMQQFPSNDAVATLRRYGVEFVVIHESFYGAGEFARVSAGLEQRPDFHLVAADVWEGGTVRLYELVRSD